MDIETVKILLLRHVPYVNSSECDLCGTHSEWSCQAIGCSWKIEDGGGDDFSDHLLEVISTLDNPLTTD